MRRQLAAIALMAASGCVHPPSPAHAPAGTEAAVHPEEAAILDVVDKFLLAVGNLDAAAMQALSVSDGTNFFQRRTASSEGVVGRRTIGDLSRALAGGDPFMERYWSPVVLVRGSIAVVWAPYELRNNGAVVHCGIDTFDMVKLDSGWRVGNIAYTMEPDACAEIAPPSVSAMRPRDGWRETRNE